MGTKRRKRGKSQYTGAYLCIGGCPSRCFVRFSLLPRCKIIQTVCLTALNIAFLRPGFLRGLVLMRLFQAVQRSDRVDAFPPRCTSRVLLIPE